MLDLEFINPNLEELSPLAIQGGHDKAFNVEAVTKQFFEDYKSVFHDLQDDLTSQTADHRWAHDYALQFLNRCMFLYFIQRKRWLGEDTEFLRSFWESYQVRQTNRLIPLSTTGSTSYSLRRSIASFTADTAISSDTNPRGTGVSPLSQRRSVHRESPRRRTRFPDF